MKTASAAPLTGPENHLSAAPNIARESGSAMYQIAIIAAAVLLVVSAAFL